MLKSKESAADIAGMSIPITPFKGRYCFRTAVYENGKRRQIRRMFDTYEEAMKGYFVFLAKQEAGEPLPANKLRLKDWLESWVGVLEDAGKSEVTIDGYRQIIRYYLVPYIGEVKLQELSEDHIRDCYRQLAARGLSTNTLKSAHRRLHAALNQALRERKITRNPATWATPPKGKAPREHIVLSQAEVEKLAKVLVEDRLAALWMLELQTGMRRGELVGLRWSQLDTDSGILAVGPQRTITPLGRVVERDSAKTKAGQRSLPLPARTLSLLRAWRGRQAAERLRLGARWRGGDYVFTTLDGNPYNPKTPTRALRKLAIAAGVRELPLHHLRHTFATQALRANVDIKAVSRALGHSTASITRDIYMHVDTEMVGSVLDAVAASYDFG